MGQSPGNRYNWNLLACLCIELLELYKGQSFGVKSLDVAEQRYTRGQDLRPDGCNKYQDDKVHHPKYQEEGFPELLEVTFSPLPMPTSDQTLKRYCFHTADVESR
ncbi:MAG: hypothetical protein ABSA01_14150 [Anaerolineales bacterium]|jgi:hypothetical protein